MRHLHRYYEGKEFEAKYKDKKPGELSAELRVRPLFLVATASPHLRG